jgi:hypothetical protein
VSEPLLAINTLVQIDGDPATRVVRVLWREPVRIADSRIVVIDIWDPQAYPEWMLDAELNAGLADGFVRTVRQDPHAARVQRHDADLLEGERKLRDRRYGIIEQLVTDPDHKILYDEFRGAEIRRVAVEAGVDLKTVRALLRLWWQGGQTPSALLPDYRKSGGRGIPRTSTVKPDGPKRGRKRDPVEGKEDITGPNIDERARRLLVLGGKKFIEGEKLSRPDAYTTTLEHYFAVGHELMPDGRLGGIIPPEDERPTQRQFEYHYDQNRDPERAITKREGRKRFLLQHRPLIGDTSPLALWPGALYEVDSTWADLGILSSLRRNRVIGRPILYVVRDRFSRMIVGFYVALEGPNWAGLKGALYCAFTDKAAWCRRFGRQLAPGEWECAHLSDRMIGDRGPAELLSANADFLIQHFFIRADTAAPSRPDWKPVAESFFDLVNNHGTAWTPGAIHGPRGRGERDPRLHAVHTLRSYYQLVLEIVLYYNNYHWLEGYEPDAEVAYDQVPLIPAELWKWGIKNRGSALRVADPEQVRLALMRNEEATLSRWGAYVPSMKVHYLLERGTKEGWFVEERGRKRRKINLGIEDWDISQAWVRLDHGKIIEPCTLHPRYQRFAGRARDEVIDDRAYQRKLARQAETEVQQDRADYLGRIDHINQKATAERDHALREEGGVVKIGTREDRRADRDLMRGGELRSTSGSGSAAGSSPAEVDESGDAAVPAVSEISLLHELEEE